jgi:diguanylate cyclase (GGDEF)-like protein
MVVHLEEFTNVNDRVADNVGDMLVTQAARRMIGALRESDTIARLGEGQFAVLPGGATDLTAATAVASKLQHACEPGFVVGDEVGRLSARIGIAMFPEHGSTTAELLARAETAMRVATHSGSRQAVFAAALGTRAARHHGVLIDLRDGIDRGELVLHYQPTIDLAAREVSGVEALVRWQHPVRGLLAASSFIPDVQRTELIEPVTTWVLNEALRQQRTWRDHGVDLTMAVNISAHSLDPSSDLAKTVAELTDTWHTPPDRLTLELNEDALSEPPGAIDILARLHLLGARISIDDYGTGRSSLAYLHRLPIDELKIDGTFVTSLSTSDDHVVVRSTIDLAHNLGLTIVAEGVEDEVAIDLLVAYGCDSAQGYHFGGPYPADELANWLTQSPYGTPRAVGG